MKKQLLHSLSLSGMLAMLSLLLIQPRAIAQTLSISDLQKADNELTAGILDDIFDLPNVVSTQFHVDNDLPYPVRVRAVRDGRSDIVQTLPPGGSFKGNIDRRSGVRIIVYAPEDCGDVEVMPSAYARVYTTETFRIKDDGIERIVADAVDPWSRVAGATLTGIALYYAPEYGPQILSEMGVREAELAACITDFVSVGCATGVLSYAQNLQDTYGEESAANNQCLQAAQVRAQAIVDSASGAPSNSPPESPSSTGGSPSAGRPTVLTENFGSSVSSELIMSEGSFLKSSDGRWTLVMQGDGNLVIYGPESPIWASNTDGQGTPAFNFAVQSDGNLVIYDAVGSTWSSGTHGQGVGPYRLVMQNDANLVLYDSTNTPTWSSGTCCQ